jgi:hypothetical protein
VKNTLNIGTNVNDGISSANITLAGSTNNPYLSLGQNPQGYNQTGIFLGKDGGTAKFSIKSNTNGLTWDGTDLTINGGGTFTGTLLAADGIFEGTITAESGEIGGWSIGTNTLSSVNNAVILDSQNKKITIKNAAGAASVIMSQADTFSSFGGTYLNGPFTAASATISGGGPTTYNRLIASNAILGASTPSGVNVFFSVTEKTVNGTEAIGVSSNVNYLTLVYSWYLKNTSTNEIITVYSDSASSTTSNNKAYIVGYNLGGSVIIPGSGQNWDLYQRITWNYGGTTSVTATLLLYPEGQWLAEEVTKFTEIIDGGIQLGYSPTRYVKMHKSGKPTSISTMMEVGGNVVINGDLDVNGALTYDTLSDRYLKENIIQIPNALYKVNDIHSLTGHDVGVIAQEVEEVLPEIVKISDRGYKSVQYEKIVVLLIEAVKELSKKVNELELNISGSI